MSNRSKPDHGIASRKRKERDLASGTMANKQNQQPPPNWSKSPSATAAGGVNKNNNWLLAGYLAHEFLTRGTLLGQKWDPAIVEANPITPRNQNNVRVGGPPGAVVAEVKKGGGPTTSIRPQRKAYADVSALLKSEGAHIEGIVNPTQLAKWLHS